MSPTPQRLETAAPSARAFIALGSNLGDSRKILGQAMARLEHLSTQALVRSSFWQTDPIDCPPGSPPFLNAVICLWPCPHETAETLLVKLQELERAFGRQSKTVLNEPRPLDLDLLAFGESVRVTEELRLPHPRAHLRRFVLAPLAEIAPELVLPSQSKSVQQLLDGLGQSQRITRLTAT